MPPPYIVTLSGARISLDAGIPSLRDVAVNHCRTPMFAGATRLPYSVAHHCVAAAELAEAEADPRVPYFTLLHEAECPAFGDIPGPVKLDGQRAVEARLRGRLFDALGTPLPPEVWARVEFYDKVEQAAAGVLMGLAEPVHQAVWEACDRATQRLAFLVVEKAFHRFPPRGQLEADSPLADHFFRQLHKYRAAAFPAGRPVLHGW